MMGKQTTAEYVESAEALFRATTSATLPHWTRPDSVPETMTSMYFHSVSNVQKRGYLVLLQFDIDGC